MKCILTYFCKFITLPYFITTVSFAKEKSTFLNQSLEQQRWGINCVVNLTGMSVERWLLVLLFDFEE